MGLRANFETLPAPAPKAWPRLLRGIEGLARRLHRAPRMLDIHQRGRRGEEIAYWSLRARGYTIVARNYRRAAGTAVPEGEIDLIALEGSTLVFVEVKTRAQAGVVGAQAAVDAAKRRHLVRLARAYRRRREYRGPHRYDVVVVYGPEAETPRIELYRDAFRERDVRTMDA